MIVLSQESELLPHRVDRPADFSRWEVLKHYQYFVFRTYRTTFISLTSNIYITYKQSKS